MPDHKVDRREHISHRVLGTYRTENKVFVAFIKLPILTKLNLVLYRIVRFHSQVSRLSGYQARLQLSLSIRKNLFSLFIPMVVVKHIHKSVSHRYNLHDDTQTG